MNLPTLFFDGDCAFCNGSVLFVLKHEKDASLMFASLQSDLAKSRFRDVELPDSLVLVEEDKIYLKSAAVFRILDYLKGWPRMFIFFKVFPSGLLDYFYDIIAKYRKRFFGTTTYCGLSKPDDSNRFVDI
ncbi:MAG: DUF393 domain-containing protein [Bacteroidetes bacterium]|nr:DUF393 domain-containing protein [Bacteroidota bacterium]MBU1581107.1 DUF393 domain-containing protein [Bacteroidota bacterium]MBU2558063.1 DUF393 domain-containing protein [Bacteroidota bacterium]